jgi:hypothetical protein
VDRKSSGNEGTGKAWPPSFPFPFRNDFKCINQIKSKTTLFPKWDICFLIYSFTPSVSTFILQYGTPGVLPKTKWKVKITPSFMQNSWDVPYLKKYFLPLSSTLGGVKTFWWLKFKNQKNRRPKSNFIILVSKLKVQRNWTLSPNFLHGSAPWHPGAWMEFLSLQSGLPSKKVMATPVSDMVCGYFVET